MMWYRMLSFEQREEKLTWNLPLLMYVNCTSAKHFIHLAAINVLIPACIIWQFLTDVTTNFFTLKHCWLPSYAPNTAREECWKWSAFLCTLRSCQGVFCSIQKAKWLYRDRSGASSCLHFSYCITLLHRGAVKHFLNEKIKTYHLWLLGTAITEWHILVVHPVAD